MSLKKLSKEAGFNTVKEFISALGERWPDKTRAWMKKYPRRIELMVMGLKYEKVQKGEFILVKRSSIEEVLVEIDNKRNQIEELEQKIKDLINGSSL